MRGSGKECVMVSHNRVEGEQCRINQPEILKQVVGPIGLFKIENIGR